MYMTEAIRAYFVNRTLPEKGTYCQADVGACEVMRAGGPGASAGAWPRLAVTRRGDQRPGCADRADD